ncbi:hypothetical protein GCM10023175_42180 [Pseudonocardia xishanensis]|uniref:Integrase-like protein n=1 Tax=Pseudonocardia xishanensis TaxID=630995 RepID=A0ABP8RVJ5_9PSEU
MRHESCFSPSHGTEVTQRPPRQGNIVTLAGGVLRVRVLAGVDPVSGRRHGLKETVPAGLNAWRQAEAIQARFVAEAAERRNPRLLPRPPRRPTYARTAWIESGSGTPCTRDHTATPPTRGRIGRRSPPDAPCPGRRARLGARVSPRHSPEASAAVDREDLAVDPGGLVGEQEGDG